MRLTLERLEDRCLPSTFHVLNLNDSGAGSLRAAIQAANASMDQDTIDCTGLRGQILLQSAILVTSPLVIQGPGAGLLAISGQDACRLFFAENTARGAIPYLEMDDLSLVHGYATGLGWGGAVNDETDATVVFNRDIFAWNHASAGGAYISHHNAHTAFNACLIANNTATNYGGGVESYGAGSTMTLNHCTISNNRAGIQGGGVESYWNGLPDAQTLVVTNSTLSGNVSGGYGGAISSWKVSAGLTISGNDFAGNVAVKGGADVFAYDAPAGLSAAQVIAANSFVGTPDVLLKD